MVYGIVSFIALLDLLVLVNAPLFVSVQGFITVVRLMILLPYDVPNTNLPLNLSADGFAAV